MVGDFYSATAARRSLVHFVFGKAGAAVSGLAVLLVTLRLVPVEAFGAYVALMALTEIFYVASGLGLSYFAQRYVPELRIRASAAQFNRQLWRLLAIRAGLAAAFALVAWLSMDWWGGSLGLQLSTSVGVVFAFILVFGSIMRYIDELLQTLLLQGWAQIQSVTRNLARLGGLGSGVLMAHGINLQFLLIVEVVVSALAVSSGLMIFRVYVRRSQPHSLHAIKLHTMPDAWRQSIRFYGAQLLAQGYSTNAIKLVVTTVVGVHGTAVLGFATSISDLLRSYSPAFLLGGWVRPIMVARFVKNPSLSALKPLTRLIVTLSIVGLLPFATVFAVFGHEVAALLAANKYPAAAPLLAPLVGVVCLQAVHAVLGMVCATVERTAFVLLATAICISTLPLAYSLTQLLGLAGTVMALCIGESLWITTVTIQLVLHFGKADFADLRGISHAVLIAVVLGVPLAIAHQHWPLMGTLEWLTAAAVTSVLYWVIAWHSRVIGPEQRALIARFLQRKSAHEVGDS